jgi:thioredoxin reductase
MARRLPLEGAQVLAVYEVQDKPSGLFRNVQQCLTDFNIPLFTRHTVTRLIGEPRLTAVEVAEVDEHFSPLAGTEKVVECDTLILSVGLIPELEVAEKIGVNINPKTKGALADENLMTNTKGVFCCGNALKVFDLVDYASDSAEQAARAAVEMVKKC